MNSEPHNKNTTENPSRFGRYQVIHTLGEGAMGRVYLAEDPVLQRLVAIKVMALEKSIAETTRREYLERFAIEARASAKLNHPSIVTIHDAGEQESVPWIAFEYVKGERLDQLLKRIKPLPFDQIRVLLLQISSALQHAHEHHIIHRDIKPANILIDSRTGIAKLADFGVVKAPWVGLTQTGVSIGSPGYMSPEQIDGSDIDARSDLFSLGVVLYEMICGKHPFVRQSVPATFFATINEEYEPVGDLRQGTPLELEAAVKSLLAAKREQRCPAAQELITLLSNTHNHPLLHHAPVSPEHKESQTFSLTLLLQFRKCILNRFKLLAKTEILKNLPMALYTGMRVLADKLVPLGWTLVGVIVPIVRKYWKRALLIALLMFFSLTLLRTFLPTKPVKLHVVTENKSRDRIPIEIIQQYETFLKEHKIDSARILVRRRIETDGESAWTHFLSGKIELREGKYASAGNSFLQCQKMGGKSILRGQMPGLLDEIERLFKNGSAPELLITLATENLSIQDHKQTYEWLEHTHYWVRWNAVKVLGASGKSVDSVKVFILDLQTARTFRTRIRAAEKLGAFGDKRAIPALEEASKRGFRDPFVAATAKDVLLKYFQKKEDAE